MHVEFPDVSFGSYPYYRDNGYGVNFVMRSTDAKQLGEAVDGVRQMIRDVGAEPVEGN